MKAKTDLESVVSAIVRSDNVKQLVAEYAEVGIDAMLEAGFAQAIPGIATLVSIYKAGLTVRDRLFTKKLLEFMGPLSRVAVERRVELIDRLERDPAYGRKVGEHLVDIIDRIEAHRKPPIIAAILLAYQGGDIDATMLHRLLHAIERMPSFEIGMVRAFAEVGSREAFRQDGRSFLSTLNLQSAGFVSAESGFGALVYRLNELGQTFLELDLDKVA